MLNFHAVVSSRKYALNVKHFMCMKIVIAEFYLEIMLTDTSDDKNFRLKNSFSNFDLWIFGEKCFIDDSHVWLRINWTLSLNLFVHFKTMLIGNKGESVFYMVVLGKCIGNFDSSDCYSCYILEFIHYAI
jgi:hypothetical protein